MKKISTDKELMEVVRRLLHEYHAQEAMNGAALYVSQNPVTALIIIGMTVTCGIPVLIFLSCVVSIVLSVFIGFIFIEGTILTISAAMLLGFMFSLFIVIATVMSAMGLIYFALTEACTFFNMPQKTVKDKVVEGVRERKND